MQTNAINAEKGIEPRTERACRESMTVVPKGDGTATVYSGETSQYTVNLVAGTCSCPDHEHNEPAGGCKHLRRTEMEAGIRDIPDLPGRTDVEIMTAQAGSQATQSVAIPDGGEVVETCKNGQEGCEGPDGDELPCFDCFQEVVE